MKAAEFRTIFCDEMRRFGYLETWKGHGPLLQGYKYPLRGGTPLPHSFWSVDLTVKGENAHATCGGKSFAGPVGDDPAETARKIISFMGLEMVEPVAEPPKSVEPLKVKACITSSDVHDADSVPLYNEGVCRHWGAFPDSPCPNERVFVVFNREPVSEEEAHTAALGYFH